MAGEVVLELVDDADWWDVDVEGEFVGVRASRVELSGCRVLRSRFSGVVLEDLRVTETTFEDCDLSGALLYDAALTRVEFRGCQLPQVVLAGAQATDVTFLDCSLAGANLRGLAGRRLVFEGCRMPAADLAGARLAGARLLDCDLTGVRFDGVDLSGARLHGSRLDEVVGVEALRGVVIDSGQAVPLALGLLGAHGITVNDDREAE